MNTDRTGSEVLDHEEAELRLHEEEVPVTDEALHSPSTPNAREAHKNQRRLDARSWAPRESVAVHFMDIAIGSQTLKRAWNPVFVRAQTTLHMLQGVLPSTGELEATRGVEQLIGEKLTKLEQDLDAEFARLKTLAKGDGLEIPADATWTDQEQIRVPLYTPFAARYLRIILKVDRLFWTLEYLWFQGTIKTEYKWQVVNTWKKNKLWDFVKFTTQTWVRARKSLQDKQRDTNTKRTKRAAAPAANDSNAGVGEAAAAAG